MDLKFAGIVALVALIGIREGNNHRSLCKEMVKQIIITFWMCKTCAVMSNSKFLKTLHSFQEAFYIL